MATTKNATKFLLSPSSFPPGSSREFTDVILRVLDTLNGTQGTAYTAEGTAADAQTQAAEAQSSATEAQIMATEAADVATAAQQSVNELVGRVDTLETESVSTTETALQSLAGPLGVTTRLEVNRTQVVGVRDTGWAVNSGSAQKGGAGDVSLSVGVAYSQAEIQAMVDEIEVNRHLLTAVIGLLINHGLAGS